MRTMAIVLWCVALPSLVGCGDDSPTDHGDVTPPANVNDLAVQTNGPRRVIATWTTPGDDGNGGGAAAFFELRAAQSEVTAEAWTQARLVGAGAPADPGVVSQQEASGLEPGRWYFAVRVYDEVPNWSGLSNVVAVDVEGFDPPAAITDLRVSNATGSTLSLEWTAPPTDRDPHYDVRYATTELTEAMWDEAIDPDGEPVPGMGGSTETYTIGGLDPLTTYFVAVKTSQEGTAWSDLSNVVEETTTGTSRLTTSTSPLGTREPSWSPDGSRIAFSSDWEAPYALRLHWIGVDGTNAALFGQIDFGRFPSWSPAGDKIAFVSERQVGMESVFELSLVDASPDASPTPFVSHAPYDIGTVAWSPDGLRIAYEVEVESFPFVREIYVADLDGGDPVLVVDRERNGEAPSWSPDGESLVFAASGSGNSDLWTVDLTSGVETQLTTSAGWEITPAWSPDGSRIVYSSNDSGTYDIWVRNLTSGETTQVTDYSEDEFDPTWNPDGHSVAFVRSSVGGTSDLWVTSVP